MQNTKELLLQIILQSPQYLFWKDLNLVYRGCSRSFARAINLNGPDDVIGKTDQQLFPAHYQQYQEEDREVIHSGKEIFDKKIVLQLKKNTPERIFSVSKIPLYQNEKIIGVLCHCIDTTKEETDKQLALDNIHNTLSLLQKKSTRVIGNNVLLNSPKEYIEQLCQYYESIIACMPGNVYWMNTDCVLMGGNDNLAKMFGLKSTTELSGLTYKKMAKLANWTEGQGDSFRKTELEIMRTKTPRLNVEEPPVMINGEKRYYLANKVPLFDQQKNVVGILGISIDITDKKKIIEELKETKKALEKAKTKAEAANEAKTLFIQNMEHDLRTPSAGVAQMIQILEDKETDSEKRELLGHLQRASKQLLELINGILDFDKMSHNNTPVFLKKFNIQEIVAGVIDLETPAAKSKGLEILFEILPNVPNIVISDSTRLYRILINLISNAIKFTPKGFIKITVQLQKRIDKKRILLKFTVKDTGIGIPADKQDIIYERFTRCTPSNQGIYPGSGLGLSIVKQLMAELGGEIDVNSELGRGTTFTCLIPFELPILEEHDSPKVIKTKTVLTKKNKKSLEKILLVEDDVIAQKIALTLLEKNCQCRIDLAKNGEETLKALKKTSYDLIFMDLGLPDHSGIDLTKKIRKLYPTQTPIIALTAHHAASIATETQMAGMNDFITKPLTTEKIQKCIAALGFQNPPPR